MKWELMVNFDIYKRIAQLYLFMEWELKNVYNINMVRCILLSKGTSVTGGVEEDLPK